MLKYMITITSLIISFFRSLFTVLGRLITLIAQKFPLFNAGIMWIVKLYCVIVLFIRSFFCKDSAMFILVPTLCLLLIKLIFPGLITFTLYIGFWLYFGVTLIAYDAIGSLISSYILKDPDHWLSTYVTVNLAKSTNVFKRYVGLHAMSALILGKTSMTSTGRAAITVGIISGIGYAINEEMNRRHDTNERALDRVVEEHKVAVEEKKVDLDEKKFAFEKQKYTDSQIKHAQSSWWSRGK